MLYFAAKSPKYLSNSGKAGASSDHDGVSIAELFDQLLNPLFLRALSVRHVSAERSHGLNPFVDALKISIWHFIVILIHSISCPHL